ncbi:MAG: tyrosine-type recombinase/integrase, partial [Blastocatellia bacterium]
VLETLLALRGGSKSSYVFPNPSTGQPWRDVKRAFAAACKEAEIEGLRFHDLRHSAGTRMADAGVPLPAVAAVLGHRDIKTTSRYAHATEESKRRAVMAIESASQQAWSRNGQEKKSAAG